MQTQADRPIRATVAGNRLELIQGGEERLRAILSLIDNAKESVRLLFYMFTPDEAGAAVRDAMAAAAGRGVRVTLLLDSYGSTADAAFFADIADQGGRFCLFHPRYGRRYLIRNHQKLVIVDDRIALIGGANIENSYLTDQGPRHWRDFWLSIEGDAVVRAAEYFDALYRWTAEVPAKLRHLRRLVFRHSQSRGPLQWKFSGPLSRRNPWPAALARDMNHAHSVDIVAAYFSPPWSMLRRLGRVGRRRGGSARVITAAQSDNNATIDAARHTYSRLLRRGVEMYEYRPARLHSKLVVADDVVYIGSANFDVRSIFLNLEIMLRIEDAGFAAAMRGYIERELAVSERITPELHKRRATWWRRFKWFVSHWLVTSMDYTVTRRLNFRLEN